MRPHCDRLNSVKFVIEYSCVRNFKTPAKTKKRQAQFKARKLRKPV